MGDKRGKRKFLVACVAALSGAALAAAVASAQGPGDYQPPPTSTTTTPSTTTTTTLPAPPEAEAELKIKTKNKQVLDGYVEVRARCGSNRCAAKGTGKLTVRRPSEQNGKQSSRARRFELKKDKAHLPEEKWKTLHLKVPSRGLRQGRKALSTQGDYVRANLRVFAIDTDGATATKKTKAKMVAP